MHTSQLLPWWFVTRSNLLMRAMLPSLEQSGLALSLCTKFRLGSGMEALKPPCALGLQVDKAKMLEMYSQQGECVEFEKPVLAKGLAALL